MQKTILLTGATDGIGLETAKTLAKGDHVLLIHGRNEQKLRATASRLSKINCAIDIDTYRADFSNLADVEDMIDRVKAKHSKLDVLINNAGVFKTSTPRTSENIDTRFIVNTIAPYILTQGLLPLMPKMGRVINLSSAAQASVNLNAFVGKSTLDDAQAYAQSKLAITMWSAHLAKSLKKSGPLVVAVNPASLLASNMVRDAYGIDGKDVSIGSGILVRAALSDEFAKANGKYYDNDNEEFSDPHKDAMDAAKNQKLVNAMEALIPVLETSYA